MLRENRAQGCFIIRSRAEMRMGRGLFTILHYYSIYHIGSTEKTKLIKIYYSIRPYFNQSIKFYDFMVYIQYD